VVIDQPTRPIVRTKKSLFVTLRLFFAKTIRAMRDVVIAPMIKAVSSIISLAVGALGSYIYLSVPFNNFDKISFLASGVSSLFGKILRISLNRI